MRTIEQTIQAGVTPFGISGRMLRIITAANPVTVRIYSESGVADGYWCKPAGGFTKIEFIAGGATYVKAVLSDGESGLDVVTITNTLGVNVLNTPAVTVSGTPSVGIAGTALVDEVKSGVLTDPAPVSVGTSATLLVSARAGRRCARFFNAGSDYVYIGSASVTVANGAVRVGPGQMWEECEGAAAAIYGISATPAQSVRIQEVG